MSLPCTLAFRIGTQGPSGPFACSQTEADSQGHEVGTVQMFATVVSGSKCYQCAATFPSCSLPSIMSQCPHCGTTHPGPLPPSLATSSSLP